MSSTKSIGNDDNTPTLAPERPRDDQTDSQGEAAPRSFRHLPLSRVEPSRYTLVGELARGGYGRILRARDLWLDRPVAIKEMLTPTSEAEPRFVAEALVTARLQHPAIVPVYEAGRWPGGQPFFSMKLVSGRSLAEIIARCPTLQERLALLPHVLAVCEAIAYAHSEHIIHRDLKPINVLVGDFGETVVIDWGLAKELARAEDAGAVALPPREENTQDGALTRAGTVVGTPAYMPPEQALGQPVDERADVYALGAILYHLLSGHRPYGSSSAEQVLQDVIQGPPSPLAERHKSIPADLLAIVAKAMAREPAGRYATARELAEDLRRFQTGQIVGAHPYSRLELLHRLVRRYRTVLTAAAVSALLLILLGVMSFLRVLSERDAADAARRQAQTQTDQLLLVQARDAVARAPNEAIAWLRELSPGFTRWSAVRTIAADARAQGLAEVLQEHALPVNHVAFTRDGRYLVTSSDDHTVRVWNLERGGSRILSGHTDEVWRLQLLPGDRRLLSSSKDGTLRSWNLETGEGTLFATLSGPVSALTLACGGRCVLAASRKDDLLHQWNLETGESQTFHTGVMGVARMLASPDGTQVLVRGYQTALSALGELEHHRFQVLTEAGSVGYGTFAPDGRMFTGNAAGQLHVWDSRSGQGRLVEQGLGPITELLMMPDGTRLAFCTQDGAVRIMDTLTKQMRELKGLEGYCTHMVSTRNGRYLVAGGTDHNAVLWDLDRSEARILRGPHESIIDIQFAPDERSMAVSSADGVRLFSVETSSSRVLPVEPDPKRHLLLSPDGQRLASLSPGQGFGLLDAASGATLFQDDSTASGMAFSPDGRWLAMGGPDGRVHLRHATTGHEERVLEGHARPLVMLVFARDGAALATADTAGDIHLWDLRSGTERMLGGQGGQVFQLAFSPEGRRLAAASDDGRVRVWTLTSGRVQVLEGHREAVRSLAFSPDGERLVSGGVDHTVRLWDLESGVSQRQDASGGGVLQVVYSPQGEVVANRSQLDGRVLLWDGRTGEFRGALVGHPGSVLDLAFSPDGTRLATASLDKTVRLWDLATRESRVLRGHTAPVETVVFFPDGRSLLTTGQEGGIRVWPDDLPRETEALRAWLKGITGDVSVSGFSGR